MPAIWFDINPSEQLWCQEDDKRHPTQQFRGAEGHYQSELCFHETLTQPEANYYDSKLL